MGRPARYWNHGVDHREGDDDFMVVGVTTVINKWGDKGGMVHAAWKLGMEGQNYRELWDRKRDIGTAIHAMVPRWLASEAPDQCHEYEKLHAVDQERAYRGLQSFQRWFEESKLDFLTCEQPFVSRMHKYGGTPDALLKSEAGEYVIADIKSGRYYPKETAAQLGAYRTLLRENGYTESPIQRGVILRFDPDSNEFSHFERGPETIEKGWTLFHYLLEAYYADKEIS